MRTDGDILTKMPAPYQGGARSILIALGIVFLAAGVLWPVVAFEIWTAWRRLFPRGIFHSAG